MTTSYLTTVVQVVDDESETELGEWESGAERNEPETESDGAETKSDEAETKSDEAETKSDEAETKSDEAETKSDEAETKSDEAETKSDEAETHSFERQLSSSDSESYSFERSSNEWDRYSYESELRSNGSETYSFKWEPNSDKSEEETDESEEELDEDEEDKLRCMNNLVYDIGKALEHCSLSDVTLKVGGEELLAHKIILASRSKVFRTMFEIDMKENRQNVVDIIDMEPSIAKEMLLFIYTGQVKELSMDRAMDLYSAADRYDLPDLKGWCRRFIQKHISTKVVWDVAYLAYLHDDDIFREAVRGVFPATWKKFESRNHAVCSSS